MQGRDLVTVFQRTDRIPTGDTQLEIWHCFISEEEQLSKREIVRRIQTRASRATVESLIYKMARNGYLEKL
jgi:hypothetical protein